MRGSVFRPSFFVSPIIRQTFPFLVHILILFGLVTSSIMVKERKIQMNTIESILSQLTSNALVADVKAVLREQDPEYPSV